MEEERKNQKWEISLEAWRQTEGHIQTVAAPLLFMGSCAWIRRFLARLTASWPEIGARLSGVEIGVDYKSLCSITGLFHLGLNGNLCF